MTLATETIQNQERAPQHVFRPGNRAGHAPQYGNGNIIHTDNPRLSYVHPRTVEKLGGKLRAQTAECVMNTFGISVNTWVKMRKGMPIRKSVAERLLKRFEMDL